MTCIVYCVFCFQAIVECVFVEFARRDSVSVISDGKEQFVIWKVTFSFKYIVCKQLTS